MVAWLPDGMGRTLRGFLGPRYLSQGIYIKNYADLYKVKKLLGYVPKINLETGIQKLVGWVLNQNIKMDNNNSENELKVRGLLN